MDRRNLSRGLVAAAVGAAVLAKKSEAQTCTAPCYSQTAAELAAGVTPSNYSFLPGDVRRYGADPTGSADSTAAIKTAINVCHFGQGANARFVQFNDGTYKTTSTINVYTHYPTHLLSPI
jgi:polygalacturonase